MTSNYSLYLFINIAAFFFFFLTLPVSPAFLKNFLLIKNFTWIEDVIGLTRLAFEN